MSWMTDQEIQNVFKMHASPEHKALCIQTILVDRITQALGKHAEALVTAGQSAEANTRRMAAFSKWIMAATIAYAVAAVVQLALQVIQVFKH